MAASYARAVDAERTLLRLAQGYQLSQSLYVVAKLGVADAVEADGSTAEALADAVGARPDELRRVLRALVAADVFIELDDGRFTLNDVAAALRADAPGSTRDVVINFGEEMYRSFGHLLHTVRTGQPGFNHEFGAPLFDYYAEHPEAEASGSARMRARSLPVAHDLAQASLGLESAALVDVAGGIGTVLAELLKAHPALNATLFERAEVLSMARPYMRDQGVGDRCSYVEGDFFTAVPEGGDVYLLKSVLHDWHDDRCRTILRNCRQAMGERGALLIVEFLLPETVVAGPQHMPALLLDLIMMTYAGGRERTVAEFSKLLADVDLRLVSVTPLPSGPHVLRAAAGATAT